MKKFFILFMLLLCGAAFADETADETAGAKTIAANQEIEASGNKVVVAVQNAR